MPEGASQLCRCASPPSDLGTLRQEGMVGTPAAKLQLDHARVHRLSARACADIIFPGQHHQTPQARTTRHYRPHARRTQCSHPTLLVSPQSIMAQDDPEARLSHLPKADGSATFSYAGYTIVGAVNGPIEVQRRDELPEEAAIDVVVRPAAGVGGAYLEATQDEEIWMADRGKQGRANATWSRYSNQHYARSSLYTISHELLYRSSYRSQSLLITNMSTPRSRRPA